MAEASCYNSIEWIDCWFLHLSIRKASRVQSLFMAKVCLWNNQLQVLHSKSCSFVSISFSSQTVYNNRIVVKMVEFIEHKVPVTQHVVCIDSQQRSTVNYPDPSFYAFDLPTPLKNVLSVELVYAMYMCPSVQDLYVNLVIDDLPCKLISNINTANVFTQLPADKQSNIYTSQLYRSIILLDKPLQKLGRLSIRFVNKTGQMFPIGEQYLRFEIVCSKYEHPDLESISQTMSMVQTVRSQPVAISASDPYILLGVDKNCSLSRLIHVFKEKSKTLKYKSGSQHEYDRLKQSFVLVAQDIKNGLGRTL